MVKALESERVMVSLAAKARPTLTPRRQGIGFLGRRILPPVNRAVSIWPGAAVSVVQMPAEHSSHFDIFARNPPSGTRPAYYVFRWYAACRAMNSAFSNMSEKVLSST
jgi:hypothetical protein